MIFLSNKRVFVHGNIDGVKVYVSVISGKLTNIFLNWFLFNNVTLTLALVHFSFRNIIATIH